MVEKGICRHLLPPDASPLRYRAQDRDQNENETDGKFKHALCLNVRRQ